MIEIRTLLIAAAVFAGPVAAADANGVSEVKACKAMAAALEPRGLEIADLVAARDEAAEVVEENGETWEDTEALRRASSSHAAAADKAKAAYDGAKQLLARREMALQAVIGDYNKDIEVFNNLCAAN